MSGPENDSENRSEYIAQYMEAAIRIGLVFLLALWCFRIMQPFIPLLAWSVIIAIALYPLHAKIALALHGRTGISAILIILFALVFLLLPTALLLDSMTRSAMKLYTHISAGALVIPAPPEQVRAWPLVGDRLYDLWYLATSNLQAALKQFYPQLKFLGGWLLDVVMNLGFTLLTFCLSLIISGVLMYKAEAATRLADRLFARLAGRRYAEYVAISRKTIRSVTLGVLGTALIQSLLAGLGLFLASIPAAGLWAFLVLLLAIIQLPVLLVLIPVCVYAYSILSPTAATLLTVWCAAVGLLDNILKPLFFGRGADIPMLIILVGAIGGLMFTGVIGLFVGAVVLSLGYKALVTWLEMD